MKLEDILDLINRIAPFEIAEKWDNSGLQAGRLSQDVKKILIGLDVTMPLMRAAKKARADMVLTHHPLLMTSGKSYNFDQMPGCAIEMAAKESIAIVSVHTNLDKAEQGLNDYFAQKIGISKTMPMVGHIPDIENEDQSTGIGRVGRLAKPVILESYARQVKDSLKLSSIRVIGNMELILETVAVCTGSGGSLITEFIDSKADLFITGDLKYHDARLIEEHSKAAIDVGHFGSEHMAIELLSNVLKQAFKTADLNIELEKFLKEKDPFTIV